MQRALLYRSIRARDQLDIFFVSAIVSLLLVRLYLEITDYPQVASGGLHIAHMLWGGLLMMVAIIINLSFLGRRATQLSAVLGGVGFGVFIDELGKFITKDNNYFFQPTIGLIYAIFVILYLSINFLSRDRGMTSREYQINALAQLEEAIALDFDEGEKRQVKQLLHKSDPKSPVTIELKKLYRTLDTTGPEEKNWLKVFSSWMDEKYIRFWQNQRSHRLVQIGFIAVAFSVLTAAFATVYANIDDVTILFTGNIDYGKELIIGQFISSLVAAGFMISGLVKLPSSRKGALEQFRRGLLVTIYLTQFFVFARIQFEALPGLIASIALLSIISFALREERRVSKL